jgi:hypothetical protein
MLPRPFTITTAATSIELGADRQGVVAFTVFNVSGRRLVGRALIHVLPGENTVSPSWLAIQDEAERVFPEDGTQHFTVTITVPPDAPAGTYMFRFDMVGVEDVNELHVPGLTIAFEVPESVGVETRRCRWCIPAAVAVVLLLIGAVAAFLLWPENEEFEIPDVRNLTPDEAVGVLVNTCEPIPCFSTITQDTPSIFIASGLVTGTSPPAGSSASRDSEVTVFVSIGPFFGSPILPFPTMELELAFPDVVIPTEDPTPSS